MTQLKYVYHSEWQRWIKSYGTKDKKICNSVMTHNLHHWNNELSPWWQAASTCKMPVNFYRMIWHNNPEHGHICCCENINTIQGRTLVRPAGKRMRIRWQQGSKWDKGRRQPGQKGRSWESKVLQTVWEIVFFLDHSYIHNLEILAWCANQVRTSKVQDFHELNSVYYWTLPQVKVIYREQ
jgi:hypothetical protein